MADRRMFSKTIIDSDAFLEMPLSTQALYFHLSMRADDEGFVNNPKRITRLVNATDDDYKLLIAKRFIIPFQSGVTVIKHWYIHNYIQKDRFKETVYKDERAMLSLKENRAYTVTDTSRIQSGYGMDTNCIQGVSSMDTERIQNVSSLDTQYSIDKYSIDKGSIGEDSIGEGSVRGETRSADAPRNAKEKPVKHKHGENKNVLLTDEELVNLQERFPADWEERINNLSWYLSNHKDKYTSHYKTILAWARNDEQKKQAPPQKSKTATELDNFYDMISAWAEKGDDGE